MNVQHNINIKTNKLKIMFVLMLWLATITSALSQAALLPNAKQQFLDQNGNPASNGRVYMYVPNTTTPKTTWQDSGQTTPNTNPVQLDAGGYATIYGQGSYQQRVLKSDNTQLWNAPTTAYGAAAPSGATGIDTAPVGTVMAWAGFTSVPTNWQFAYGQEVSRTTFSDLMTAITISHTAVACTSGSSTLAGWPDTSQIRVGAPIEATCIPTGTVVVSIPTNSTIVVSNNAVSTATTTARIFPWGNGNGVDTFNVPDLRGTVMAGPDAMGGMPASRLTSVYYGANASPPAVFGGNQSRALTQTHLPSLDLPVSGVAARIANPQIMVTATGASSGNGIPQGTNQSTGPFVSNAWTGNVVFDSFGTAATGGASTPFSVVQPTMTINYIIKMAANTSGAGGVVSLGGLFGDIICGSNVFCGMVDNVPTIQFTGSGSGSVSSVGLAMPSIFSVTGSPITSFGTLTASLVPQTANTVLAGPTTGTADVPTFRNLIGAEFGSQPANQVLAAPDSSAGAPMFRYLNANDFPAGVGIGSCGFMNNMAFSPLNTSPTTKRWLIGPAHFISCLSAGWNRDSTPSGASVFSTSFPIWVMNIGQGGRGAFLQALIDNQTWNGHGCSGIDCVSSAGQYINVTFTNATPTTVTWASAHGLTAGRPVAFCPGGQFFYGADCQYTPAGVLPTGITENTVYYACAASLTSTTTQLSSTYDNALAGTCDIGTSSTGSGVIKGNTGRVGGFDPDQIPVQPTASTVYAVFLVARPNATGPDDWGLVIGANGCSAAGPGATVQATYPYWMCLDWIATNGAPQPTGFQYTTMKNNHYWQFAGGTGTGAAGTATIYQFATGVQAQWTGVDLNSVSGGTLDHNTGMFTISAAVSTNGEFARVANNVHFGNYIPCGSVGVSGVVVSTQCTVLPDEGVIALWSNSASTFYYLIGGSSGF